MIFINEIFFAFPGHRRSGVDNKVVPDAEIGQVFGTAVS